jgi:HK97 family phage prohead protease
VTLLETKENQFKGLLGSAFQLDTKQVTETGEFEGYGSVYGNVDNGGDIVKAGAFDECLRTKPASKIKMLWQHDTHTPIGVWSQLSSDSKGLYCRGKLLLNTQGGKEAHEFMLAGAVDGLSIGYQTKEYEYDNDTFVRTLIKVDLMEISVVTFPMNEQSTVSAVKAAANIKTIREFEGFLRDVGGFSHAAAKAIAAGGFKSLEPRDEDGALADLLEALKSARQGLSS